MPEAALVAVAEAVAVMNVVAGGTDDYPARVGRPLDDAVVDISALDGLRAITDTGDAWRIRKSG